MPTVEGIHLLYLEINKIFSLSCQPICNSAIQRLAVLQDVKDHRITQVHAAEILNISTRQITRLLLKLTQDRFIGSSIDIHKIANGIYKY